jgi:hypothetical protein
MIHPVDTNSWALRNYRHWAVVAYICIDEAYNQAHLAHVPITSEAAWTMYGNSLLDQMEWLWMVIVNEGHIPGTGVHIIQD